MERYQQTRVHCVEYTICIHNLFPTQLELAFDLNLDIQRVMLWGGPSDVSSSQAQAFGEPLQTTVCDSICRCRYISSFYSLILTTKPPIFFLLFLFSSFQPEAVRESSTGQQAQPIHPSLFLISIAQPISKAGCSESSVVNSPTSQPTIFSAGRVRADTNLEVLLVVEPVQSSDCSPYEEEEKKGKRRTSQAVSSQYSRSKSKRVRLDASLVGEITEIHFPDYYVRLLLDKICCAMTA